MELDMKAVKMARRASFVRKSGYCAGFSKSRQQNRGKKMKTCQKCKEWTLPPTMRVECGKNGKKIKDAAWILEYGWPAIPKHCPM